ncbi:MAG: hypothetical protein PG980_000799 [Wolbachia endosymbiont of Ctenocephalides felis wCfeJ]|nr:MAG: hypothetical protein PG980_000799 [Wolbachia endosymbiont of Ctenocephalides felis wCfeJ]
MSIFSKSILKDANHCQEKINQYIHGHKHMRCKKVDISRVAYSNNPFISYTSKWLSIKGLVFYTFGSCVQLFTPKEICLTVC